MIHAHWLQVFEIAGSYTAIDVVPEDMPARLASLLADGFVGGNVTVPHKEIAFRSVAKRDAAATAIGAVNTLWFEGTTLVGGNTDAAGFIANLDDVIPNWSAETAVVLGAGGAARAALHALHQRGVTVRMINRTASRAEGIAATVAGCTSHGWNELPDLLPSTDLLVNTTTLGMVGKDAMIIDLTPLKSTAIVYDIVYIPLETDFLRAARTRGLRTVDGLGMLLHQAGPRLRALVRQNTPRHPRTARPGGSQPRGMNDIAEPSSRDRLLDAAQRLFAAHGYNGVSVRDIANEAGVNSASIGYYFGGKEKLLAEVYRLSCAPIKAERQRRLAELDKAGPPSIVALVDAFIRPALASEPSGTFLHIRTILSAENADILTDLTATNFDDSSLDFIERLVAALPHLTRDQVFWRFHFLLCTIYYSASGPQRIAALSNNRCDPRDTDALLENLVPFLAAGLTAP